MIDNSTDSLYKSKFTPTVLCPQLYNILNNTFPGGVRLSNQGETYIGSSYRRPDGTIHSVCHSSGEYYCVNCPFCHDTRKRLWVNYRYGQQDPDGKPMYYLAHCYNEDCLASPDNWKKLIDMIYGFKNANTRTRPVFSVSAPSWVNIGQTKKAELPGELISLVELAKISPNHPAVVYMCQDRRYDFNTLDKFNIQYCTSAQSKYPLAQHRIIFPLYMHGELQGWQARFVGEADWRHTPKYYGMPGMKKNQILYNYDNVRDEDYVVIVEGVTDCHALKHNAVAILGKTLSQYHVNLIVNTWKNKHAIVLLDPEAYSDAVKIFQVLKDNRVNASIVTLPDGYDCGDYDTTTLWNVICSKLIEDGINIPGLT